MTETTTLEPLVVEQTETKPGYAGQNVTELSAEISGAVDPQGPAVDLIMLRDFVRAYGEGVEAESYDFLVAAIDGHLKDLMKAARKAGKEAFRRSPRKFAKRLTKSVRRDLTPPASADDNVA